MFRNKLGSVLGFVFLGSFLLEPGFDLVYRFADGASLEPIHFPFGLV